LNSKYFDVLLLLVSRPNQLITRQELFEQIWNDVIVTDWALSQCIKDIRKALGDEATAPRYLKTIPSMDLCLSGNRFRSRKMNRYFRRSNR